MGSSEMGIVFAGAGAVTVLVRGVAVGRLVRRIGEVRTVRIGCVVLALGLGTIPLINSPLWLVALVPAWALATGILFPSLASLVSQATDAHSQGSILGGSQVVGGLGRVVGPIWAGLLFQSVHLGSPFVLGALLSVVALGMSMRIPGAARSWPAGTSSKASPPSGAASPLDPAATVGVESAGVAGTDPGPTTA